ncbi:MAG TPA: rhodanese-like domain-containing protein [Acidimicrobiia bacterium]|nr:rhodanese-like domain-containing protein [Acidimicrobiia bacterium]
MRKLMLALLVLVAACSSSATGVIELVGAVEANELLEGDVVVLDIRTPEEYAEGHIQGSLNIDFYGADFPDRIGALDADHAYLVYCRSGSRSAQAMSVFEDLGFSEVFELEGGILTWVGEGLPLVTSG